MFLPKVPGRSHTPNSSITAFTLRSSSPSTWGVEEVGGGAVGFFGGEGYGCVCRSVGVSGWGGGVGAWEQAAWSEL